MTLLPFKVTFRSPHKLPGIIFTARIRNTSVWLNLYVISERPKKSVWSVDSRVGFFFLRTSAFLFHESSSMQEGLNCIFFQNGFTSLYIPNFCGLQIQDISNKVCSEEKKKNTTLWNYSCCLFATLSHTQISLTDKFCNVK